MKARDRVLTRGVRGAILCLLPVATLATVASAAGSNAHPAAVARQSYSYATNGVWADASDRLGDRWKLLLDPSVLGGKALEMAEVTLPAGTVVRAHRHHALEVIDVLAGVYGHEVNGKLYLLTPGMVGIVRPGDSVRHLVPRSGAARLLIIWAPAGEAARVVPRGVPVAPLQPARSLEP